MKNKTNIKKITIMALLIAMAYVSLLFIRIPIIPSASFLRYDIKDIFITIGGLLFGPIYSIVGALCISFLQMISVSEYGFIGLIMNILSVTSFSWTTSLIYKSKKDKIGLIIGLVFGSITMVFAMLLWNYFITPFYMEVTRESVARMLIPIFLPFNVIKSTINSIFTFIMYKGLISILERKFIFEE